MKLLLIVFLMGCVFHVCAQSYLDHSSKWTESSGICGFDGTCTVTHFMITMNGDTVINGKTYFKTHLTGTETTYDLAGDSILSIVPFSRPSHLIREEQSKFYRYHANLDDDILFANFDLEVGDTAVSNSCGSLRIVDHIDTIYLGNIPRKHFYFSTSEIGTSLIEGVGSTKGLFYLPCSEIGIEFGSSLLCYSQNGNLMEIDTSADCSQTVSVIPNSYSSSKFKLFPNPINDYINIACESITPPEGFNIKLFNLEGKLLLQQTMGSPIEIIDISTLSAGMYVVFIFDGQKWFSYRIMKV